MFSHDKDTYESNLEKGLHLINSHEGLVIQEGFEKEGLLEMYIRRGARWEALLDTVIVNMETLPISGEVYWRQKTIVGEQERFWEQPPRLSFPPGRALKKTETD